jgi:membrane-bound lytic murein transglycosylase D
LHSRDIARWNHIRLKAPLPLGKKLIIKKAKKITKKYTQRKSVIQPIRYTVRSGDSLSTISEKFNVRVADLRKWNKNSLGKYLKLGQKLKVKVDTTQPST